jgi:hypothetical protein
LVKRITAHFGSVDAFCDRAASRGTAIPRRLVFGWLAKTRQEFDPRYLPILSSALSAVARSGEHARLKARLAMCIRPPISGLPALKDSSARDLPALQKERSELRLALLAQSNRDRDFAPLSAAEHYKLEKLRRRTK